MEEIIDNEWGVDLTDLDLDGAESGNQTDPEPAEAHEAEEHPEDKPAPETTEVKDTPAQETPAEPEGGNHTTTDTGFEVNVLGEKRTYTKEEAIPLIQKGADYDRVHQKYDELKGEVERLTTSQAASNATINHLQKLADQYNGGNLDGFIHSLRVSSFMKWHGMDAEAAEKAVKNEDISAELAANQQRQAEAQKQQAAQADQKKAQEAELLEFCRKYPGVTDIPKEVWAERNSGQSSLTNAYAHYMQAQADQKKIAELEAKLAAQQQNDTNRGKAVGSASTSGQNRVNDEFLSGFDAEGW